MNRKIIYRLVQRKAHRTLNRVSRSLVIGLLLAMLLAACSGPTTTTPPAVPVVTSAPALAPEPAVTWPSELFVVRPEGQAGPLVAYDMADGQQRFKLPAGWLSADGQHYFAAETDGRETSFQAFDPETGEPGLRLDLNGAWALSGVSGNGRWASLTRLSDEDERQSWAAANEWKTEIQILDTQTGQFMDPISLDGNFEVDALSPHGDSLFLIEYLPAVNPDHYQIRLFNLGARTLQEGALVDKRAPDEVMAGERQDAVTSRDGLWIHTLYLRAQHHSAFIHALNTFDKFTLCIDLPWNGDSTPEQLQAYTLSLAPSGRLIYAANPAMGLVARVNLDDLSVSTVARFDPVSAPLERLTRSLMSSDGQQFYFTSGQSLWSYDTESREVSGPYQTGAPITGLGLSSDGQRLYAAHSDGALSVLKAADGQALTFPGQANTASR